MVAVVGVVDSAMAQQGPLRNGMILRKIDLRQRVDGQVEMKNVRRRIPMKGWVRASDWWVRCMIGKRWAWAASSDATSHCGWGGRSGKGSCHAEGQAECRCGGKGKCRAICAHGSFDWVRASVCVELADKGEAYMEERVISHSCLNACCE